MSSRDCSESWGRIEAYEAGTTQLATHCEGDFARILIDRVLSTSMVLERPHRERIVTKGMRVIKTIGQVEIDEPICTI